MTTKPNTDTIAVVPELEELVDPLLTILDANDSPRVREAVVRYALHVGHFVGGGALSTTIVERRDPYVPWKARF